MSLAVAPSPSIHKSALLIPKPYPKSFWSPSSSIHSTSTLYRPTQSSEGSKMPASAVPARPVASRRSSVASNTSSKAIPTPAIPAKLLSIGEKDTSSSSGTVFAKPTKEWVIPERAKPGRKVAAEDPDNVSTIQHVSFVRGFLLIGRNGKLRTGSRREHIELVGPTTLPLSKNVYDNLKRMRFTPMSDYKR